jgi:ATP-dependent Clp protease ATP-binding subunit ClpB
MATGNVVKEAYMALRRKIPRILNKQYPFLEEVDFERLRLRLAGRLLTQPAKASANGQHTPGDDTAKIEFSHLVGIQPGLDKLRMIMSSSQVNNAWITGPTGIGKTILVEALLRARAENRLTSQLMSRPYYIFDVDSFATASYGKPPVEILDKALDEAAKRGGIIIIDHMDDFMQTAGPALAGTLASTFVKHLESDQNLQAIIVSESDKSTVIRDASTGIGRRFQILEVTKEPNDVELRQILIAHFAGLERKHNVNFSEQTADEIIRLLSRYPGRAFVGARPHNAILLADRVATYVHLSKYAEPAEVMEKREQIRLLEDQLNLILTDGEQAGEQREKIEQQIAEMTVSYSELDSVWKKKFEPLFKLRKQFEEMDARLTCIRNIPDSERSKPDIEFYDACLEPDPRTKATPYDRKKAEIAAREKALYPEPPLVEPRHVRLIFSQESGVPTSTLSENRLEHLAGVDAHLDKEIVRQEEPKRAISTAYFQRETGISDPSRPAGVFMFLGGTGLGKTELVKALARYDGGEGAEPLIIRLSEFKGKEACKKLTGADPGYVGFEQGSCLDAVKKNPRALVLLDEADKGDPSLYDIFMQVLEEGKLTPSNSKEPLEFKDTILVLASNALKASDFSSKDMKDEAVIRERLKKVVNPDTGQPQFKPEFLGRIDRIFVFEDLETSDHVQIFRKEIRKINRDYKGRGISVEVSDETAAEILGLYNDVTVGGRLSRNISNKHIRPLITGYLKERIREIMNEDVKFKADLRLEFYDGKISLKPAEAMPAGAVAPKVAEAVIVPT